MKKTWRGAHLMFKYFGITKIDGAYFNFVPIKKIGDLITCFKYN